MTLHAEEAKSLQESGPKDLQVKVRLDVIFADPFCVIAETQTTNMIDELNQKYKMSKIHF